MTHKKSILLIGAVILLTYGNSLFNGFYGDAQGLFQNNNFYKRPANIKFLFSKNLVTTNEQLSAVFSLDEVAYSGMISYRPLTAVSFFTDYFLWRDQPAGFHLTDIFLHFICSVLLYFFALEIFGGSVVALWLTLLFATHSIHSEVINSIAYRSDILAAIFCLASFLAFLISQRSSDKRGLWLMGAYASFAVSLLAKESAIILPILIWFYDRLFLRKDKERQHADYGTWFSFALIAGGYLYLYLFVIGHSFYPKFIPIADPVAHALVVFKIFLMYVTAFLLPFKTTVLPPVYMPGIQSMTALEIAFVLSIIVALVWLAVRFWKKDKVIVFGVIWFFVTYSPVSNILAVLPNPIAFRFLYFPAIGIFFLLAVLGKKIWKTCERHSGLASWGKIALLALLGLNMSVTVSLNTFFKSTVTAAKEMVYNYPDSTRPYWNLAFIYYEQGKLAEAQSYLQKFWETPERNPYILDAQHSPYVYLLFSRCEETDHRRAIAYLKRSLDLQPNDAVVYADLAKRYILLARYQDALDSALMALKLRPQTALGYVYAAHSYLMLGNFVQAENYLQQGLQLAPHDPNLNYLKNLIQQKRTHAL